MACHLRSVSLPTRTHSLVLKVEEELQKLRACVASSSSTAQMVFDGLKGLGDLYESIKELLCLSSNQNGLSHSNQKKWVEEEMEESIRLLDICGATRDNFSTMKINVQDLQVALRRGTEAAVESKLRAFVHLVKKANKDIKKQSNNKCGTGSPVKEDGDSLVVVRLLIEAREITIFLFQSVLSVLNKQMVRPKNGKWSLVSRTFQKRRAAGEEKEDDDASIFSSYFCKDLDDGRVLKAQKQMQTLESSIEGLENGLECLFRQLIHCRVSLLNICCS